MTKHVNTPQQASTRPRFFADLSVSAIVAGFIAVVVSYSGPMVIVLAAAQAGHLTSGQTASWIWAISIGSGLTCVLLSLRTRMPIITAFSTPGAALLVTSLGNYSYSDAIGAFLIAAVAMTIVGFSGLFGTFIAKVPTAIVSAMLAGILFSFGVGAFHALSTAPLIVATVLVGYVVTKRFNPRYAVLCALTAGTIVTVLSGRLHVTGLRIEFAIPEWTTPSLSISAIIGISIPLFLVTAASQNAPGLAVLKSSGYQTRDRFLIGSTGLTSAFLAPFGSHAVNLAAITAAICTNEEAHPNPQRRYPAGVACGVFYIIIGLLGSTLLGLFTGLPKELVAVIAGAALLGALTSGLVGALEKPDHREAALVTFLTTSSGLTLFGIGSAFWGLIFGIFTHAMLTYRQKRE